jgi:hypothetical protein
MNSETLVVNIRDSSFFDFFLSVKIIILHSRYISQTLATRQARLQINKSFSFFYFAQMNILSIACLFILNLVSPPLTMADDEKPSSDAQNIYGQVIKLDADARKLSGIETLILKPASHSAEFTAYGKAINLQPLLDLRNRYLLALTERSSAQAKFEAEDQNINRQQDLYSHGVGSKRNLQEQQAHWQSSKAQADASYFQGKAIFDEALLFWGKELTNWAMSSNSKKLGEFLSGRQRLLQITLPANRHLPDTVKTVYIDASGNRGKAHKAELISVATRTETVAQGESYYFQTGDTNIITGMNVTAWVPESNEQITGVVIPKSALIWYMDQAIVYLKTAEDTFSRRTLDHYSVSADGYFIPGAIKPGEQIVIKGAQILLSEELRGQIPKEDSD